MFLLDEQAGDEEAVGAYEIDEGLDPFPDGMPCTARCTMPHGRWRMERKGKQGKGLSR